MALVDTNNSSNYVIVGGYGNFKAVDPENPDTTDPYNLEYVYESYGAVGITPGTYKFALIPNEGDMYYMKTFTGAIYSPAIDESTAKFYITSTSGTINVAKGNGIGTPGVTIAPNGIMVYFDPDTYLQFVQVDGKIHAVFKVNGSDKITPVDPNS